MEPRKQWSRGAVSGPPVAGYATVIAVPFVVAAVSIVLFAEAGVIVAVRNPAEPGFGCSKGFAWMVKALRGPDPYAFSKFRSYSALLNCLSQGN